MEIVLHSHHAAVSDRLRARAEQGLTRLGRRVPGVVDGRLRFEQDGSTRVVELTLHAPGRRHLVAKARGRHWGPAIAEALAQLEQQIGSAKRTRKEQGRDGIAERRALGG